ncbi:MAG: hypothetical protein MUE41_17520, partial [Gemmatimonadaceae bacterium]|nr:hypothetical protein [Gemmatimonadaceae bacterium]
MLTLVVAPSMSERVRALLATLPAYRSKVRLREVADPLLVDDADVIVTDAGVTLPFDWADQRPPHLLPTLAVDAASLSAMLALASHDEAAAVAAVPALDGELAVLTAIADGTALPTARGLGRAARDRHNTGVRLHYADAPDFEHALSAYTDALLDAPSPSAHAFTARQAATLLIDTGRLDEALALLQAVMVDDIPAAARESIEALRLGVELERMSPMTPDTTLETLAADFDTLCTALDQRGNTLRAALLRLDRSRVLQRIGRFEEGRDAIDEARALFEEAESPELLATAGLRRGELLHAWAQAGARHQYKYALEAFQGALKVFTKDTAPTLFASIH